MNNLAFITLSKLLPFESLESRMRPWILVMESSALPLTRVLILGNFLSLSRSQFLQVRNEEVLPY